MDTDPLDDVPSILVDAPEPPARKGWNKLAWVGILAMVALIIVARSLPLGEKQEAKAEKGESLVLKLMEVQFRALVAMRNHLVSTDEEIEEVYKSAKQFGKGPADQRLRFIPIAGELGGPEKASEQLVALELDNVPLDAEQTRLRDIMKRLYADYRAKRFEHPSVQDAEALELVQHLGWCGELALHPRGSAPAEREEVLRPANFAGLVLLVAMCLAVTLLVLGVCGLILFGLLWLGGQVTVGLERGIPHGGVYAETFCLWLVLYFGLALAAAFFLDDVPLLARGSITMLLSLSVLAWPVLRGISWSQVRRDIGWTLGRQPLLEPLFGAFCYVINVPIAALGFFCTFVLLLVQSLVMNALDGGDPAGIGPAPTHPILNYLSDGDLASYFQIFFLLSVVAPLVEETMFRGILHRNVRETNPFLGALLGGLFTTTVVNFLFAAVHPQGLATIPVLMALAFGFSLAREWRGTLVPGMVGHGLNNGMVALLGILLLSK
jgi:membrane protease YdiL (CAAX protease family)